MARPARLRRRLAAGQRAPRLARLPASSRRLADQPGADRGGRDRRLPDPGPAPAWPGADLHPVHRRVGRAADGAADRRRPVLRGPRRAGLSRAWRAGPGRAAHSHSMVPGGLLVMSSTTRLISGTSLVILVEIVASTASGSRAQSAVMASSLVTGRSTTG